ncbi:heavy-metal-associated domain-containing protein [Clostridium sp. Ade.TY]|uniref:heavy-metal-associated domain-containing protein n=1 Tax=Clostridium sp. Ade.TY TaxID=1391647 RepID=UPI000405D159|nr:heavy-metal-associated domain-containing protein [Clostridium sp. Ade.TY]
MKAVLKVAGIKNSTDVRNVQSAIANCEGVVASEISSDKKEVTVIFNNNYINIEKIIDNIEEFGYTVI